jgi:hypothetical protein
MSTERHGGSLREIMYRDALREAMAAEMKKDPHLFLMAYDVGKYGGEHRISGNLFEMFGDLRVKDAPISEQVIVGCGIGAAVTGCRSIVRSLHGFLPMCMDMVANQAIVYHMFGGQMNAHGGAHQGGPLRAAQAPQCLRPGGPCQAEDRPALHPSTPRGSCSPPCGPQPRDFHRA